MKRTTVSLPDDLAAAVGREARRRRTSVSEVTREALASHLGLNGDEPRKLSFIGIAKGDGSPIDVEEYLAEHWADDIEHDRGS